MTSLPHFHFDLPQNDVHVNIEPFFSVSEEEVKENKKNLMMELEWFTRYTDHIRKHQVSYAPFKQMMWAPFWREQWIEYVNEYVNKIKKIYNIQEFPYVKRILQCNEYVASMSAPRVRFVPIMRQPIQRKSWLQRCLSWLGCGKTDCIQEVLVNLKTKEVVLCTYYAK